jgi:hypothetical protein
MTTLVATDLDRTMIFSRKACRVGAEGDPLELVEVEIHDGTATSFMTATAAVRFVHLVARTLVVPVTTRIPEQLARVTLPGPPRPFAIAANGGHLFVDGVLDRTWSVRVAATLAEGFPLAAVWEHVGHVCHPEFTRKLRNACDLFCYAVIRPEHLPGGFVDDVTGWAAERGWRISLQGRKLYWVPEVLTKSAAVAEVAARVGADRVLAAGDSLLDVDLLLRADRGIHPQHGELFESGWSAPSVVQTRATGAAAGQEIVDWFIAQLAEQTS